MTILKMNKNPLFLLVRNQNQFSPEDLSTQSTLILNDQKEPLLRAFENHHTKIVMLKALKSNSNKHNKNKDVSDSQTGIFNFNSQSTEAESTDSTTRSSNIATVT
jgi:hypothetical protein